MRRQKPPQALQAEILDAYGHACGYCGIPFGSVVRWGRRTIATVVNWDHAIPYAYLLGNPGLNWVAACGQCNGVKSDLIFRDMLELREYIAQRRSVHGWQVLWYSPVASTEDPERWAIKFATFLARQDGLLTVEFTRPRKLKRAKPIERQAS